MHALHLHQCHHLVLLLVEVAEDSLLVGAQILALVARLAHLAANPT